MLIMLMKVLVCAVEHDGDACLSVPIFCCKRYSIVCILSKQLKTTQAISFCTVILCKTGLCLLLKG